MAYELNQAISAQLPNAPDRPSLARISDAADELARIAGYIESFIERCRGSEPTGAAGLAAIPSGHLGQLDRLNENLHRVDCLARELQTIG